MPATEVARRAGHGVAVLLKIYAHCVDGQADAANRRTTDALGSQDAQPEPGDEGIDTASRHPKSAGNTPEGVYLTVGEIDATANVLHPDHGPGFRS